MSHVIYARARCSGSLVRPVRLNTAVGYLATLAETGLAAAAMATVSEPEYAMSVLFQDFEKGLMLEMEGKVYLLGDNGGRWLAP